MYGDPHFLRQISHFLLKILTLHKTKRYVGVATLIRETEPKYFGFAKFGHRKGVFGKQRRGNLMNYLGVRISDKRCATMTRNSRRCFGGCDYDHMDK